MILRQKRCQWSFVGLIFFFCIAPAHYLNAAGTDISKGPVTIEADSIAYDQEKDTYHAKGNVIIVSQGSVLTADSVILNEATNDSIAEGHVILRSGGDILEGDKVELNIESKTGVAYQGKIFIAVNHFYIKGSKIEKTGESSYRVENATATSCDGDFPAWRLTGKELNVTIEGYGSLKNSEFMVSNVPILYSPYLFFPAKTTRQSGFLYPYTAYSADRLGWDVEIPYYWAISEDMDATFYQRYMDKRGFKEGVELRYFPSVDTFGTFYGDFMNDTARITETNETTGGIPRDWQSDHKRWSYYLNFETKFDPTSYIRTDLHKVSDSFYFQDFASHNYYLDNYSVTEADKFRKVPFYADQTLASLNSTVRMNKNWQLYNLTALISYTDDFSSASNDATLQKYPEIELKGIKRPIFGSPVNFEFDTVYDYYYRNEGEKGHLFDLQPAFTLPLRWHDFLQFTPQVGFKSTSWSRDDNVDTGQSKQGSRELYSIGATANTEIHRIFDIGGTDVDKIRHGIRPELTHIYIPDVSQTDLPDYATAIPAQNTLTYSLTNTLLAKLNEKGGEKSYLEFLRLKLSQTYDFNETAGKPFSDVDIELDVKPFKYFSFMARNVYSVNSREWLQTNYDMSVSDWRGDSATVGYRYAKTTVNVVNPATATTPFTSFLYSQTPGEELDLSFKAVVTQSVDLIYILRKDQLDGLILERTYGVKYHKQCWGIEAYYSESENDRQFIIGVSLLGLGKFGGK